MSATTLATLCAGAGCRHTYNWHIRTGSCDVEGCSCLVFKHLLAAPPPEPAEPSEGYPICSECDKPKASMEASVMAFETDDMCWGHPPQKPEPAGPALPSMDPADWPSEAAVDAELSKHMGPQCRHREMWRDGDVFRCKDMDGMGCRGHLPVGDNGWPAGWEHAAEPPPPADAMPSAEEADAILRDAGEDPEAVGKRGADFIAQLHAAARELDSKPPSERVPNLREDRTARYFADRPEQAAMVERALAEGEPAAPGATLEQYGEVFAKVAATVTHPPEDVEGLPAAVRAFCKFLSHPEPPADAVEAAWLIVHGVGAADSMRVVGESAVLERAAAALTAHAAPLEAEVKRLREALRWIANGEYENGRYADAGDLMDFAESAITEAPNE